MSGPLGDGARLCCVGESEVLVVLLCWARGGAQGILPPSELYHRHVPGPVSIPRCTSSSSLARPINMYTLYASRVHALPQYCLACPRLSPFSCHSHKPPIHPSTHPPPSTAKSPLGWRARSLKQRRPAPGRSSRSATPTKPNHRPAHHFSLPIALSSHARALAADLRACLC